MKVKKKPTAPKPRGPQINLRLTAGEMAAYRSYAARAGRDLSGLIRTLLSGSVWQHGTQAEKDLLTGGGK